VCSSDLAALVGLPFLTVLIAELLGDGLGAMQSCRF